MNNGVCINTVADNFSNNIIYKTFIYKKCIKH